MQLHIVCILHVVRLFVGFPVKIYYAVFYLKGLTGQTYTSLDVILASVSGACDNLTILRSVASKFLSSGFVYGVEIPYPVGSRERVGIRALPML